MKALTLSDDDRVSYNRAPERKRMIYHRNIIPLIVQFIHGMLSLLSINLLTSKYKISCIMIITTI